MEELVEMGPDGEQAEEELELELMESQITREEVSFTRERKLVFYFKQMNKKPMIMKSNCTKKINVLICRC